MNFKEAAKVIAEIIGAASLAAPEPFGAIMRIAAAGLTVGAEAIDNGATEAEVIAHIHRVHHIPV